MKLIQIKVYAVPCMVRSNCVSKVRLMASHWRNNRTRVTVTSVDTGETSRYETDIKMRRAQGITECELEKYFYDEQEHVIVVEEKQRGQWHPVAQCSLYSLHDDLFLLTPLKGDFHLHSEATEGHCGDPAGIAVACRQVGLDFMTIADHMRYTSLRECRDVFGEIPVGIRIFPGEELEIPGTPFRAVSFGGTEGVSPYLADTAEFNAAVQRTMHTLGRVPEGVDASVYASVVVCFARIRAVEGMGILCLPQRSGVDSFGCPLRESRCDIPDPLIKHLLARRPFDALELLGSHTLDGAYTAFGDRWREACSRKYEIPVVGSGGGDSQREVPGRFFSIVLTQTDALADIAESIRANRCVAIDARPGIGGDSMPKVYGPPRLEKLASFLIREVFPRHDEICRAEVVAMCLALTDYEPTVQQFSALADSQRIHMDTCRNATRILSRTGLLWDMRCEKSDPPAPEQAAAARELGVPAEITLAKSGIVLRLIPPGTFIMGSPMSEEGRDEDEVQHNVTLTRAYYMGKYPVTQDQYMRVMENRPAYRAAVAEDPWMVEELWGETNPSRFHCDGYALPVEGVYRKNCMEFMTTLCMMEGLPDGTCRLPTEAEWEYACRAGAQTAFCHGDELTSDMAACSFAWYPIKRWERDNDDMTSPVGLYKPNAWGLYDMHGNVYELCSDWYGKYDGNAVDPTGPATGSERVVRGGIYFDEPPGCRSAARYTMCDEKPENKHPAHGYVGFRIVMTVQEIRNRMVNE